MEDILVSIAAFALMAALFCLYNFVIEPEQNKKNNEKKKNKHPGHPVSLDFEAFGEDQVD
jgi:hypothetical protein